MRLWSSSKLERELARGQLSEWEKTKYLLLPLILGSLAGGPIYLITPRYGPTRPTLGSVGMLCGGVLMALVTYYGIRMGYRANQKIDGEHFIERYTVLSVPIFIKFVVGFIPAMIGMMIVARALGTALPFVKQNLSFILQLVFPLVYLWFYSLVAASIRNFGLQLRHAHSPASEWSNREQRP